MTRRFLSYVAPGVLFVMLFPVVFSERGLINIAAWASLLFTWIFALATEEELSSEVSDAKKAKFFREAWMYAGIGATIFIAAVIWSSLMLAAAALVWIFYAIIVLVITLGSHIELQKT